uniref:glutathione gamma-glutamylcysteinyltransferase n=1 Tax=Angiostrongylus cantonensis TaxID=6313 RepID=A0A158P7B6_ANGCA
MSDYPHNFLDFLSALRRDIRVAVSGDKEVIVASYDRSQLQQTGTGHFSPLAAFHVASDRVLIMDVARFKYPPHWVQLDHLQKAMCSIDPSTKRTRGYAKLQLRQNSRPLVAFSLKANLSCNDTTFHGCCQLTEALSEASQTVCSEVLQTSIGGLFVNCATAALMLAWPYEVNHLVSNIMMREKSHNDKVVQKYSRSYFSSSIDSAIYINGMLSTVVFIKPIGPDDDKVLLAEDELQLQVKRQTMMFCTLNSVKV